MLLRTKIYSWLNSLFGTPTVVQADTYALTDYTFEVHTQHFLASHANSFTGKALVVGCGTGVEIGWIAERCESVCAVDVDKNAMEAAKKLNDGHSNVTYAIVEDRLPLEDESIDVIFMHDVCEHIINLEHWFTEYHRVLKPGGVFINQFCPLFYSPYGAHMSDALKVPWGHLIFGVKAIVEVRNQYYPGESKATKWEHLGLNRVTKNGYQKITKKTGFKSTYFSYETSKNVPLGWVPGLRNLFIIKITDIMKKA